MFNRDNDWFEAILKLPDGSVVAKGLANVVVPQRSVNFSADFVPLFPLGESLTVARIFDGNEIHRFTGTVYLSGKTLLRIVSVDDELLTGSEEIYCDRFDLPLELTRRVGLRQKTFSVRLMSLNSTGLVFTGDIRADLNTDDRFTVKECGLRFLVGAEIIVRAPLMVGLSSGYRCEFTSLSKDARFELKCYLRTYNLANNKLF